MWEALRQIALTGYADARLHGHILHSVQLVLMGFAVAVATGVPLGLAMGWSRRVEALANPAFLLIRPIPPLAWIPLAIVWLGLGDAAKVLVIWFAAFVPSVINSYAGVRTIEPHMLEAARMLGIGRWTLVREVLVPGAAPMIFTGLRLSCRRAGPRWSRRELIGAAAGLGRVLSQGALDIFPAMILVGMVGVGLRRRRHDLGARLDRAARHAVATMSLRLLSRDRAWSAFFGMWTLIALSGLVQPQFLPTPLAVARQFC